MALLVVGNAFGGCYTTLSRGSRTALQLTVDNGGLLCGDRDSTLTVEVSEPAHFLNQGKLESPLVSLNGANQEAVTLQASLADDGKRLLVAIPSGLAGGSYQLRVVRVSDSNLNLVDNAVTIVPPPAVDSTRGGVACTSGTNTSELRLVGANLRGAKVKLNGLNLSLPSTVNEAGTELVATLPATLPAGGPYDVLVETGVGCSVVLPQGVSVVGQPVLSSSKAGPPLLTLDNNGAVAVSATYSTKEPLTVQLRGNNLVAGIDVRLDGVSADFVTTAAGVAAGQGVDATFAAGTLSEKTYALSVQVGGCSTVAPGSIVMRSPTLNIDNASPRKVASSADPRFVTVRGDFSAALERTSFYVDTDQDPASVSLVPLQLRSWLDNERHYARAELSAALPAAAMPYDLHVITSGGASAVRREALSVSNLAVPTLVTKTKTSLQGDAVGGDSFSVIGCDLGSASFALQNGDGSLLSLPAPTLQPIANTDVFYRQFRCSAGRYADVRADFSSLTLAPGLYRLVIPEVQEDLFPIAVFRSTPTVSQARTRSQQLSTPRRQARGAELTDASGRRFLYTIGGTSAAEASPTVMGSNNLLPHSYEMVALDPTHNLFAASESQLGSDRRVERVSPSGSFGTLVEIDETYGAAITGVGGRLLVAGGSTGSLVNPTQTDAIYHSRLVDPYDRPKVENTTLQDGGSGTTTPLWVAFTQRYSAYDGRDPLTESELSSPTLAALSSFERTLNVQLSTHCGTPTDLGQDLGYPIIAVYTAPVGADALPPEPSAFRFVANIQPTETSACSAQAPLITQLSLSSLSYSAGNGAPPPPGKLAPLRRSNLVLADPTFGADGGLLTTGTQTVWMVMGGVGTRAINNITLGSEGIPASINGTAIELSNDHAFASATGGDSIVLSTGGFQTGDELDSCVLGRSSFAGRTGSPPSVLLTDGGSDILAATARLGKTLFSFGGAVFTCGVQDRVGFSSSIKARIADSTSVFATTATSLPVARAGATPFAAPPYIYLFGGVESDGSDDTVTDVVVSNAVVQITTLP